MTNIALARGSVAIERAFIFLISSGGEKSCDLELYVKKDFSPPARNHSCERGRDGITGAKSFLDPAQRYYADSVLTETFQESATSLSPLLTASRRNVWRFAPESVPWLHPKYLFAREWLKPRAGTCRPSADNQRRIKFYPHRCVR